MRLLLKISLPLGALVVLVACASPAPNWERQMGDAVRQTRALQTLHPDAPVQNTASPRMDGKAAQEANQRYVDSFKTPTPQNVINIGVGSNATGGGNR